MYSNVVYSVGGVWALNILMYKINTFRPNLHTWRAIASFVWFILSGLSVWLYGANVMPVCSSVRVPKHRWDDDEQNSSILNETWHSRQLTFVYYDFELFERFDKTLPPTQWYLRHEMEDNNMSEQCQFVIFSDASAHPLPQAQIIDGISEYSYIDPVSNENENQNRKSVDAFWKYGWNYRVVCAMLLFSRMVDYYYLMLCVWRMQFDFFTFIV